MQFNKMKTLPKRLMPRFKPVPAESDCQAVTLATKYYEGYTVLKLKHFESELGCLCAATNTKPSSRLISKKKITCAVKMHETVSRWLTFRLKSVYGCFSLLSSFGDKSNDPTFLFIIQKKNFNSWKKKCKEDKSPPSLEFFCQKKN